MSDLIQDFPGNKQSEWIEWYQELHPDAIENAANKINDMIEKLKEAIHKVDKEMIQNWVEDVIFNKTFAGLRFQESILKRISSMKKLSYRLATSDEESKGIDGYIGSTPVSIKPESYKTKPMLNENISCQIIYYSKTKTGIVVEIDFELL